VVFSFGKPGLIQLHREDTATAFLRAITITRVRQEMLERSEQERAKSSLHFIGSRVGAILDELCKKTLSEILRIM
jgi:hypothetical protein